MPKFQCDQVVICVDDYTCCYIKKGQEYTIDRVLDDGDKVILKGLTNAYMAKRFTIACPNLYNKCTVKKGDLIKFGSGSVLYTVRYVDFETKSVIAVAQSNQGLYEIPFNKVVPYDPDGVVVVKFLTGFNTNKEYYFKLKRYSSLKVHDLVYLPSYGESVIVKHLYRSPTCEQKARANVYLQGQVLVKGREI